MLFNSEKDLVSDVISGLTYPICLYCASSISSCCFSSSSSFSFFLASSWSFLPLFWSFLFRLVSLEIMKSFSFTRLSSFFTSLFSLSNL